MKTLWLGYLEGINRYADFNGRSDWRNYLCFFAVNIAVGALLRLLELIVGGGLFEVLGLVYALAVLLPGLAVTVRVLRNL